ncbi:DUF3073 domain-containing protein [Ornithinimicrobium sp. W1679]|uniref:DUF3073 domain-containing protein n=1 Tax=unclassified Ornithinimicrobium TaxID=2615080 RepID=UPI003CEDA335
MGRGRAKAKQIKVARKLKYNSAPSTDLTALERELRSGRGEFTYESDHADADEEDDDQDPYAAYVDDSDDDDESDDGAWAPGGTR